MLKIAQNLFVVMPSCFFGYSYASFESLCGKKDLLTAVTAACCSLLAFDATMCCSAPDPKKGCRTSTG